MGLKEIVENNDTRLGRYFDLSIQCLIVFSIITFSIETLPNLSSKAMDRIVRVFEVAKEYLALFALATCMMLFGSAVGIYYFENEAQPETFASVFHALWWPVTTLTTVGYGDMYPITVGGRVFSFLVLMIGLGIVAVPAGLMASALSKARAEQDNEQQ